MKFVNFAVVKFSTFLVAGILFAHFFPVSYSFLLPVVILFLAVFLFWLSSRGKLIPTIYFGITTYLCFFTIGYFGYQLRLPTFQPAHYQHIISSEKTELLHIKIIQTLKPDKFNHKYLADVAIVNKTPTTGKVLLHIRKDSTNSHFSSDEILLVYATISEIPQPLNPHQFNYSRYMKSLGVFGQVRISGNEILSSKKGTMTLLGAAQNLRSEVIDKLKKTKLKTDERAIIQALVLGERKEIDKNIYDNYAAAGAVHILAVSGLHVGILYLVLAFLFKPLKRWKYGVYLHSFIIVLLLWGFAMLSGLSPSVTRAVSMFSFFAIATIFGRRTNSINILFLSLLSLLIVNPLWLFQVGFQLSYLAVFFILWLHPIFYKLGYSKYIIIRKLWSLVAVTLCAQLGVLPLSLYYFHQFPGLFLLTNIVILPFLTLLMCGGILIVAFAIADILPNWLAESYNFLIESLNRFIHWIAVQEDFLFKDISFSTLKVVGTYLLIISLGFLLKNINYRKIAFSLITISILISIYIYDEFQSSKNELVVFQKSRQTILGYKNGRDLKVFKSDTSRNISEEHPLKSYSINVNSKSYSEESLPQIFRFKERNILIVDSLNVFPKDGNIHILLLVNNPKTNLNRLMDSLKPQHIIADGSNSFSAVKRWEKTSLEKGIPFSHTAKEGAFIID